jgi:hypothetical protein
LSVKSPQRPVSRGASADTADLHFGAISASKRI